MYERNYKTAASYSKYVKKGVYRKAILSCSFLSVQSHVVHKIVEDSSSMIGFSLVRADSERDMLGIELGH